MTAHKAVTYGLALLALLTGLGWAKSYLQGPDLSFVTAFKVKPVPVAVTETKWLTKVVHEKVTVLVEVVKYLPPPAAKALKDEFHVTLEQLHAENKSLATVLAVPKAPYGGDMAVTVNIGTGKVEGIFVGHSQPFFALGGLREAGVEYDVIGRSAQAYYRQDIARVGPVVVGGRASASQHGFAASLTASMRF